MEQTIIDFFAKSSELILHNRLSTAKTLEAALNQITNPNPWKFQLNFEQKFNFSTKIPSQWHSQTNKLLVIEFFLSSKATKEKFLVEQWVFELNQVPDSKLKYTIDSPNTLYKKLSVLLRTLSLLTMTLPLYRNFIGDKSNQLCEEFSIQHSIHFTRHNLSNWHPSVHEDKNLIGYANPDLVLPGRTFAFKVSYAKSLKFIQSAVEESLAQKQTTHPLKFLKEQLDLEYFGPKTRDRTPSEDMIHAYMKSARKSTSETNRGNFSNCGNMSPRDINLLGNEGISDNASPILSILTSSPIETQRSPIEGRPRKSSGGIFGWDLNRNVVGSRPRIGTIDSENSEEYEMYIYENAEGKYTEVLSGKEIPVRVESPRRFSLHPPANEDPQNLAGVTRKLDIYELKLSTNSKPIEKIIEKTDDDKIAEVIKAIEDLRDCYYQPFLKEKSTKSLSKATSIDDKVKLKSVAPMGLKFFSLPDDAENLNKNLSTVCSDYENFVKLYAQLKK